MGDKVAATYSNPTLAPGSPEWQKLVTPSKIAGILGISRWADPYTTWHRMAGNLPPEETTEAMQRGTDLEPVVLKRFFRRHPELTLIPGSSVTVQQSSWLAVTPDAIATRTNGTRVLIEAKTTERWDHWGEPYTEAIPEDYWPQVIVAAHVLECDEIIVTAMGPFFDDREYYLNPDPELAEAVLAKTKQFWDTVQTGVEPELSSTTASYEAWTKLATGAPTGEVEIDPELAIRYLTAVAGEKDVKPAKAAIVNALEAAGAKTAVCQGQKVATRQRSAHGMSLVVARKLPHITKEAA